MADEADASENLCGGELRCWIFRKVVGVEPVMIWLLAITENESP